MGNGSQWATVSSFSGGENSDIDSRSMPDNALQSAFNVITDKTGRLVKRGPIVPYLTTAQTAFYDALGTSDDSESLALQIGYGARLSTVSASKVCLDSFLLAGNSSAVATNVATSNHDIGQYSAGKIGNSFSTFGLCGFPVHENLQTVGATYNNLPFIWAGGATADVGAFQTTVGSAIVTAGSSTVQFGTLGLYNTFKATDMVGQFFYAAVGAGTNQYEYVGKIVAQNDAGFSITVSPPPKNTFAATYYSRSTTFGMAGANFETGGGARPMGATLGAIHQNRAVCVAQGQSQYASLSAFTAPVYTPMSASSNTITWSAITSEGATAVNTKSDGLLALLYAGWPKSQTITLDTAGITGIVSIDANNLMVLCVDKILMLSGTLGTVLPNASVNTNSINIRTLSNNIGCAYPASIQRTPAGIMFSDTNTVYLTDGATFTNTMENKIQFSYGYFKGSLGIFGNDFPCGSAVILNNYYILFTKYGKHLICDVSNNLSWSRFTTGDTTGVPYDFMPAAWGSGITDPTGSSQVYAPKFAVDAGANYSSSGSRICRLDTIAITDALIPATSAGFYQAKDADCGVINADILTKAFTFGTPRLKWIKKAMFLYSVNATEASATQCVTVTAREETTADPFGTAQSTVFLPSQTKPTLVRRAMPVTTGAGTARFDANAIAFQITTNYTATATAPFPAVINPFALYEIEVNYNTLRQGRTVA